MKNTPLYAEHVALGGRIVDFGGWALPTQYPDGILKEHAQVRERAGLFDVSHMGEIMVTGHGARAFVATLMTNNPLPASTGQAVYGVMLYENGCAVDDLIAYIYSDEKVLLVVNASNDDKDFEYISSLAPSGITLEHASPRFGQLALQGPMAESLLQGSVNISLREIKPFHFIDDNCLVSGVPVIISRTGYTGEDGFELYCAWDDTVALWNSLLKIDGILPIGLGARDTLRFEAKLPLYGHELSQEITPLEASLSRFVKFDHEFVGRAALEAQKAEGLKRKLCEIELTGRGIPRAGMEISANGAVIGHITSGGVAPTIGKPIALALIDIAYTAPETEIEVIIRDKPVPASVRRGLFYKRSK